MNDKDRVDFIYSKTEKFIEDYIASMDESYKPLARACWREIISIENDPFKWQFIEWLEFLSLLKVNGCVKQLLIEHVEQELALAHHFVWHHVFEDGYYELMVKVRSKFLVLIGQYCEGNEQCIQQ